jgi:hypothetical protein
MFSDKEDVVRKAVEIANQASRDAMATDDLIASISQEKRNISAGTPITDALSGYTHYTAEQLEALEAMKDRAYTFGIAKAEYVNKVLRPDGTVSDDVGAMQLAASGARDALLKGDTSDPAILRAAADVAARAKEIDDHIGQRRFLFIVGPDGLPVIYFQCATPDNKEAMTALSPHADDHPVLVADHPDPDAHAAHAAEVSARITKVIADAKAKAKATATKTEG